MPLDRTSTRALYQQLADRLRMHGLWPVARRAAVAATEFTQDAPGLELDVSPFTGAA